jgi:hypothetical protein
MEINNILHKEDEGYIFRKVGNELVYLKKYPLVVENIYPSKGFAFPIRVDVNLSQKERPIVYLHEIHHHVLDKELPFYVQDILAFFPKIRESDLNCNDFPLISEIYKKTLVNDFDFFERENFSSWIEVLKELNFSSEKYKEEIFNKMKSVSQLMHICREKFYTESSKNLVNVLERKFPEIFKNIENKISEAYGLYEKINF